MIQKPTIRLTEALTSQWLYKRGVNLIYSPYTVKQGYKQNVVPQHMHLLSDKDIKPGDAFYDEIDQSTHICTFHSLDMVHSAEKSIINTHAFLIVGSTDQELNVTPINDAYIKLYCETGGEIDAPDNIPTSGIKIKIQALLVRGMEAALKQGRAEGINSDTSNKFIEDWIAKNFIL